MNFASDKPGRVIGSVIVLQAMVSQLLAKHPDGQAILNKFDNFPRGLEPSPDQSERTFDFLADISAGSQDTIDEVRRLVDLAGGFQK